MSLQNSYVEALTPNVMVLGGGTSGKELNLDEVEVWWGVSSRWN